MRPSRSRGPAPAGEAPARPARRAKSKSEASARPREPRRPGGLWWRLALAVASGCLIFLSFPDYDLWPLGWVALLPLFVAIEGVRTRRALLLGTVVGFVATLGGFTWIVYLLREFGHLSNAVSIPLFVVGAFVLGSQYGLFAALTTSLRRRTGFSVALVAPVVFVAVEFAFPLLFPWYYGNGQYAVPLVTQIADLTGVLGVSGLLVATQAALYAFGAALLRRAPLPWRSVLVAAGLVAATLGYGALRIVQTDAAAAAAPRLRIGMVEANVGIWEKEAQTLPPDEQLPVLFHNILKHQRGAAELERRGADLIVWPESSYIPVFASYAKVTPHFAVAAGEAGALAVLHADHWVAPERPGQARIRWPREANAGNWLAAAAAWEREAYVVGTGGRVLRFDGETWQPETSGTDRALTCLWANPVAAEAWRGERLRAVAGGAGGLLVERRDDGWRPVRLPSDAAVVALAGPDAAHLHAFMADGTRFVHDGKVWKAATARPPFTPRAACSPPDGRVVIAGAGGRLAQWSGENWRALDAHTQADFAAVACTPQGDVHAVGANGLWVRSGTAGLVTVPGTGGTALLAVAGDGRGGALACGAGGACLRLARGASKPSPMKPTRGTAPVRALAELGFRRYYPLPHDAQYLYVSPHPLPAVQGYPAEVQADDPTPIADRNAVQRGFTTPVLMGLVTEGEPPAGGSTPRDYNTAMLIDRDGRVAGRYDKVYLLVFGEYIPFGETFPELYEWIPEAGHFTPGTEVRTFPFGPYRLGVLICYEDILPRFTARVADLEPHVFINVTNDAWFGKTAEPYQHLALASFRAIEHRLWLVRSTNTGISAYVDAVGRILEPTDLDTAELRLKDVPMLESRTLYSVLGDWLAWVAVALVAVGYGFAWVRRRRAR